MKMTNKTKLWTGHIEAQLTSRQTQRMYCEHHSLNLHTFRFWKRKLSRNPAHGIIKERSKTHTPRSTYTDQFIPIQISREKTAELKDMPLIQLEINQDMSVSIKISNKNNVH